MFTRTYVIFLLCLCLVNTAFAQHTSIVISESVNQQQDSQHQLDNINKTAKPPKSQDDSATIAANRNKVSAEHHSDNSATIAANRNKVSAEHHSDNSAEQQSDNHSSKQKLKALLNTMAFFSADFIQKVVDEEGSVIQQDSGRLMVSKPNLVRWHILTPDETLIVSDGKVLWLYDPFIEQASVYTLDAAIADTPILLLSSNDQTLWDNYSVNQLSELTYSINANDVNSRIKTLTVSFAKRSVKQAIKYSLTSLSLLDATGQLSLIELDNIDNTKPPAIDLFNFTLPEGVYLDDQR